MNTIPLSRIRAACVAAAILLLSASPAFAGITAAPSTITVARGEAASRSITYRFLDETNGTYFSEGGEFLAGLDYLGANNQALSAVVVSGTGVANETLTVPVAVIERALSRHTNVITYQRFFSNGLSNIGVQVQIIITSEAGSDFEVKRLELYFANRRAETTVHRNDKGLKAYVDVRYAGTGVLQARWEVDGRVLATVNRSLVSAGNIVLESPDIPALPTFDPGSHVVRFVITSPSPELTVPSIVYYVQPDESGPVDIGLLTPGDGEEVEALPRDFSWAGSALASVYLVRYYENPASDPVFSAYTYNTTYSLVSELPGGVMAAGGTYYWKVIALDSEGATVGESPLGSFVLKQQ